jgi:aminoglycoside/choline kinase family phosphotransferase
VVNGVPDLDFAPLRALIGNGDITAMPGGASTRRYFRVERSGGGSAVAMFVPDDAKPEEIGKDGARARWPFLEVRDLLDSRGVDVPVVYAEDCATGWIVLEDLGDDTLANFLLRAPEKKPELYTRAIEDLAHAQQRLADLPEGSIVRTRAFDEDLLRWEIDHFREWGLEARGLVLSAEQRDQLDGIAARLARKIAAWPRGFVHRDYQSRNLMVRPTEKLCWIDFQDALMGPRIYDVVALLSDSYQEFDRAFVQGRLAEFARALRLPSVEGLETEFDTMTVQRKLKDAGRFVFIDRVKKNPSFLKFVVPTIHKVKASLARLDDPDMRALDALLSRVLPPDEWRC